MVNLRYGRKYCKDDLSLVENFENAVASEEMYVFHHKLEIELGVSQKWLKEHNLYYKRPASELILLTKEEHINIHNMRGSNHPMYGRHHTDETKKKISSRNCGRKYTAEYKSKRSKLTKGEKNPMYGKHHSSETKDKISNKAKARLKDKTSHPRYIFIPEEELLYLRYKKNYTLKELAEHFGVSLSCVHGHLKCCS